jgi:ferric-dicitrate binding protein FerR (iron transport regulator)
VLGTSFNVDAYPDAKLVQVTVETGKVSLNSQAEKSGEKQEILLNPGEKGTLDWAANSLTKTMNNNPNFMAWKTRNLIFKATALSEVVENLAKVYQVDIRLADSHLNGLLLTAQFNDYPLEFIMKIIESTFDLEVHIENGQYILKARS